MNGDRWTSLCPGPSLAHLVLDEKECGNIVAVNSALLAPVRRVDFWAVGDSPNTVHYPCRKRAAPCLALQKGPILRRVGSPEWSGARRNSPRSVSFSFAGVAIPG